MADTDVTTTLASYPVDSKTVLGRAFLHTRDVVPTQATIAQEVADRVSTRKDPVVILQKKIDSGMTNTPVN